MEIFKVLLKYELQRLHTPGYSSNLGYLHIERAAHVGGILGIEKQKELMNDLVQMLKSNLNPSDFVSFYNSSTIIFSFVDKPYEEANKAIQEMMDLSNRLISKTYEKVKIDLKLELQALSLGSEVEPSINSMVFPLSKL
jgi:hypothetical protein